jgi:hypothetical protein
MYHYSGATAGYYPVKNGMYLGSILMGGSCDTSCTIAGINIYSKAGEDWVADSMASTFTIETIKSGLTNTEHRFHVTNKGNIGLQGTDAYYDVDINGDLRVKDNLYLGGSTVSATGETNMMWNDGAVEVSSDLRLGSGNPKFRIRSYTPVTQVIGDYTIEGELVITIDGVDHTLLTLTKP